MDKIKIGDVVFGKVTGIEKYGIFLSLDDNINGLIHISEISNSFVKNVEDYASIGETIKAKVIAIDHNYEKLKLSIKGAYKRTLLLCPWFNSELRHHFFDSYLWL